MHYQSVIAYNLEILLNLTNHLHFITLAISDICMRQLTRYVKRGQFISVYNNGQLEFKRNHIFIFQSEHHQF